MKSKKIILILSLILIGSFLCSSCKKEEGKTEDPPDPQMTIPVLATQDAADVTESSAKTGGNVTADGGATVTERGVCYSASSNPNITDDLKIQSGSGTGIFDCNIAALDQSTEYFYKAYAINSAGVGYGVQKSFTTLSGGPTFTDPRDGQVYDIVDIGNQAWFAENLNYETSNSWCYDNNSGYCDTHGRLYNWLSARTACPDGWHLPTDDEWKEMEKALGMSQSQADLAGWRGTDEGKKLKSTSGWVSNGNGTNSSGFSALAAGKRGTDSDFNYKGLWALFWTDTQWSDNAMYRLLTYEEDRIRRYNSSKYNAYSVRCLKD